MPQDQKSKSHMVYVDGRLEIHTRGDGSSRPANYDDYQQWMDRTIHRFVRRHPECSTDFAEDLYQQSWTDLLQWQSKKPQQRKIHGKLMLRAMHYRWLMHLRHDSRERDRIYRQAVADDSRRVARQQIADICDGVSDDARKVVILRLCGATKPEIADITGLSERTIARRIEEFRLAA